MAVMVIVNGKKEYIQEDICLVDFLAGKKLDPAAVIVEHNLKIVAQARFKDIILKENDQLEVLRVVGGG
jgi:sulfur carrier protein